MSVWSYVTGIVKVHAPGISDEESEYIVKKVAKHLPIIHGEEGDAAVNVLPDISCKDFLFRDDRGIETQYSGPMFWDSDRKYTSKHSYYLITISGSLRGAEFSQALNETQKLLFRLAKKLIVEEISVTVRCFNKSYTFSKSEPFTDVYDYEGDNQAWRKDLQRRIWDAEENAYYFYVIDGEGTVFIYRDDAKEWKKDKNLKGKIKRMRII